MKTLKKLLIANVAVALASACAMGTEPAENTKHLLPESEYPYWGEYRKVKYTDVKAAEWDWNNSIKDGWDWSLPPNVKPDESSYSMIYRANMRGMKKISELKPVEFPSIPVVGFWCDWKDIEKNEGEYDFQPLINMIKAAAEKGYGSMVRIHTAAPIFAPKWLEKYNVNIIENRKGKGDKVTPYDPSHPEFHKRYLKLVEALGASGIPQMKEVKGMYVGYASHSYGDEGIGPVPEDKNPDKFGHVLERLDAWAKISKGVERKVFMGGYSEYGLSKGFGIRRGFVEMYLYHIPDEIIGQRIDPNGYLYVDEENKIIKSGVRHGEENEEYSEMWTEPRTRYRFGRTTDSFQYRFFTSTLRLLQMRVNDVMWNNDWVINPEMFVWAGLEMGRTAKNAPDAWCALRESYLRESYMKKAGVTDASSGVKNFERWIYQRDSEGYETEPAVRINHAIKMWMVSPGKYYDYVARTGNKIGFFVDDNFLKGRNKKVAVKISYFDFGKGKFSLEYSHDGEIKKETVECGNSGKLKTATFFITADFLKNMPLKHDFEIVGTDGYKPVVSFFRVVKVGNRGKK